MSPTTSSAALRHRAAALHDLASTIERTPAMTLDRFDGDDTWRGPRPLLCHHVLVANLAQLRAAVEDLRSNAARLERQASQLEAAALIELPPLGERAR